MIFLYITQVAPEVESSSQLTSINRNAKISNSLCFFLKLDMNCSNMYVIDFMGILIPIIIVFLDLAIKTNFALLLYFTNIMLTNSCKYYDIL